MYNYVDFNKDEDSEALFLKKTFFSQINVFKLN